MGSARDLVPFRQGSLPPQEKVLVRFPSRGAAGLKAYGRPP
jgi:hypothetical protein